jgi:hypothetical protein
MPRCKPSEASLSGHPPRRSLFYALKADPAMRGARGGWGCPSSAQWASKISHRNSAVRNSLNERRPELKVYVKVGSTLAMNWFANQHPTNLLFGFASLLVEDRRSQQRWCKYFCWRFFATVNVTGLVRHSTRVHAQRIRANKCKKQCSARID